MAGIPRGRAGRAAIEVTGLAPFLAAARRADARFDPLMRVAAQQVAQLLVDRTQARAHGPHAAVWSALKARRDRVPVIALNHGTIIHRSGARRAKARDVFFGAEFGGQARPTTRQFLPHLGRVAYVFWPTVRESTTEIADTYLRAVDRVLDDLANG